MLKFILYWSNGRIEIVTGASISDAFEKAGYSNETTVNLSNWEGGTVPNYVWENNNWVKSKISYEAK